MTSTNDCPDIFIDFAGSVKINPKHINFIQLNNSKKITGKEYILLNDEDKSNCILEDIMIAINKGNTQWCEMDITEDT